MNRRRLALLGTTAISGIAVAATSISQVVAGAGRYVVQSPLGRYLIQS